MATSINKPRILVIGKSGVGKTSVVAELLDGDVRNTKLEISNRARGVTFQCDRYENDRFVLFDTIGFGASEDKNVCTAPAKRL